VRQAAHAVADEAAEPRSRNGARSRGRTGRRQTIKGAELRTAYLFVLPAFVVYLVFMLFPFVTSILYSFTSWDGVSLELPFVGLDNYLEMPGDSELWGAFRNNIVWIIVGTIAPVSIGLLLALILWTTKRGALGLRTLFFVPYITPPVVIGLVWIWIYHPLFGGLNSLLEFLGLDSWTGGWLGDPSTALIAVLIAAIWSAFGFTTTMLFAGLQAVDVSLVEAAAIDGANWWQRARHVVIPEIAPVLTLVTAVTLIGGFSVVDFVLIMTGGGPGNASQVLGLYAYDKGFRVNQVGYGAAVSTMITLLTLIAAVTFVRLRERERHV
jgi:raffinose/stachyose/melibiose transport system permease protein